MTGRETTLKPKILVAPLDWGLGHATRCIPIIRQLLNEGCEVIIGAEGRTENLLKQEFPSLEVLPLKGYHIQYGKNKWDLLGKITIQIPKILERIDEETDWLYRMAEKHHIDAVISDNRYGLHHDDIPTAFITHQLLIKTPLGKFSDGVLQKLNYEFIEQFSECWIPDVEGEENLAGELSHPSKLPSVPVHYIGPLSRFEYAGNASESNSLLIILSGPEPQRSLFEDLVTEQLIGMKQEATIIRGLPGESAVPDLPEHIKQYNHLGAAELQSEIEKASFVISRAGYSSVMDLLKLQKKTIMMPTPGQTEQEYLAKHLMQKQFAFTVEQEKFRLKPILDLASFFPYNTPGIHKETHLQAVISSFLQRIKKT